MQEQPQKPRIGLLRQLTNGNLGNAAFEAAFVQNLVEYFPDARFYVCCIDSLEGLKSYDVRLFPVNRDAERRAREGGASSTIASSPAVQIQPQSFVRLRRSPLMRPVLVFLRTIRKSGELAKQTMFWLRSYSFAKNLTVLIICGGGQVTDTWGGAWGHPFTLYMWTALARISGTPLLILNVGMEQVPSSLSRSLLKRVLRRARYRSFRDSDSKRAIEAWGPIGPSYVYPDLAFSYKISTAVERERSNTVKGVIGISPMSFGDPRSWPVADSDVYQKYLHALASFARTMIKQGYTLVMFVSQIRMDQGALHDLKELVLRDNPGAENRVRESNPRTVDEFLSLITQVDLVVASRMHAILLSQLMYTPVLAISYENKIDALMTGLALSEFCMDIRRVEEASLIECFSLLQSKQYLVREALRKRVGEYREALREQYDLVFGQGSKVLPGLSEKFCSRDQ